MILITKARSVRKRSGFVFPSTDRVTRLVNRKYHTWTYIRERMKEKSI